MKSKVLLALFVALACVVFVAIDWKSHACERNVTQWLRHCTQGDSAASLAGFDVRRIAMAAGAHEERVEEQLRCFTAPGTSEANTDIRIRTRKCGKAEILCAHATPNPGDAFGFVCEGGMVVRASFLEFPSEKLLSASSCFECAWPTVE